MEVSGEFKKNAFLARDQVQKLPLYICGGKVCFFLLLLLFKFIIKEVFIYPLNFQENCDFKKKIENTLYGKTLLVPLIWGEIKTKSSML